MSSALALGGRYTRINQKEKEEKDKRKRKEKKEKRVILLHIFHFKIQQFPTYKNL